MKVRIEQSSACAGCKVAAHCSASERKEKVIDIYDKASMAGRKTGDHVTVVASIQTGMRAVLLGFGIPFLILILTLVIVYKLSGNELIAAISSIVALIPYYIIIYLLRDHLRKKFSFVVE